MSKQSLEPAVTVELAAEYGLSADEYQRMLEITGRTPSFTELGIFSVMWSEHCSYKSSQGLAEAVADDGAPCHLRSGRERRRDRHRRRAGRHLQDGKPQPPLLHRALSGCGDRSWRHPARRLHDGRAADRQHERAALRQPRPSQDPPPDFRRGRGHRRLRQLRGRADGRRRDEFPSRPSTAISWSTR